MKSRTHSTAAENPLGTQIPSAVDGVNFEHVSHNDHVGHSERSASLEQDLLHPFLSMIDAKTREMLLRNSSLVTYRAKRNLIRAGESPNRIFLIIKGAVRIFLRDSKSEVLLSMVGAPAICGDIEALSSRVSQENVESVVETTALSIPASLFIYALERTPPLAQALATDMALRLSNASDSIRAQAFDDVEQRLAKILVNYAELFGVKDSDGVRINLPLSQEQLSRDLAATRKSLGRAFARLKKQGLVNKVNTRYVIHSVAALNSGATSSARR